MKKNELITIPHSGFFLFILIVAFISCTKKTETTSEPTDNKNRGILKIGDCVYTQEEFERSCAAFEKSGLSADSSVKRALNACFVNSILVNHLNHQNYTLSDSDKHKLAFINRNTLIRLAKDSVLKAFEIDGEYVMEEIKRYQNKQIVIDLIWLPEKNNGLIDECYSTLNSGGNIVDMLVGKKYYERIVSINGVIKRVNVKPGMFYPEISDFIVNGDEAETKTIHVGKGCCIVKIIYKKEDSFVNWDYYETELNLKLLELDKSGLGFGKIKMSDINIEVVNTADFSVRALDPKSEFVAQYEGEDISLSEIKEQINALPFDERIFFSNKSCLPSALAALVLLESEKPVGTKDLINEFNIDENHPANKKEYFDYFEYQYLVLYEKTSVYPWLYPWLFDGFKKVKVNYDQIYNNELVNHKACGLNDTLAYTTTASLTVGDFINELNKVSKFSISQVLQIENARKLIYYFFESTYNISPLDVRVKNDLLENAIIGYAKNLSFFAFTANIFATDDFGARTPYRSNINVLVSEKLQLSLGELRSLISLYPLGTQYAFSVDKVNPCKFWRVNALWEVLQDQLWVKKAQELNLHNSESFKLMTKKNEQKLLTRAYLKTNIDSDFFADIKAIGGNLEINHDPVFFEEYRVYINKLNEAYCEKKSVLSQGQGVLNK